MEITQIRYFLEVAESQHITKSAEKLHIAQPALSQSIKRLENELGVPLFKKNGRNILLTRYGKYAKEKLDNVIQELDNLSSDLDAMAHVERHTIYINVLAASTFITNAIIKYQEQNKDIKFKLTQNESSDNYDIQVNTKLFYQQSSENINEYIHNEKIYLAVPNSDKFKDIDTISLKEVESLGFISLAGSRQFRYICDKFCHHAGIKPNYIFESDNPNAVQNMIAANMGVGFWPEHSWGEKTSEKIKLLKISDFDLSRDIILSCNNESECIYAKDFYEFLINSIKDI